MSKRYTQRINSTHSQWRITLIPIISVLLASVLPDIFFIASSPFLPSFSLMIFMGWMVLRPGIWPLWSAVTFGIWDDVFSGQPMGSAVVIWSAILLIYDQIEERMPWRSHWQDWLIASVFLIIAHFIAAIFALYIPVEDSFRATLFFSPMILGTQLIIAICGFPLILRLIYRLDQARWKK